MNDNDVIGMVQTGDTQAFAVLVRKYQYKLLNFIYRLTNDKNHVEDIGQEVFLRVYKSLKRFDIKRGVPFSAWLFIIARNYCINEIKKGGKMKYVSLNEQTAQTTGSETHDDMLIHKEQREALAGSVEQLPEPFKSTILKSLEGKSLHTIAKEQAVPQGTVKSRLSRAKQKLTRFIHTFSGEKP